MSLSLEGVLAVRNIGRCTLVQRFRHGMSLHTTNTRYSIQTSRQSLSLTTEPHYKSTNLTPLIECKADDQNSSSFLDDLFDKALKARHLEELREHLIYDQMLAMLKPGSSYIPYVFHLEEE